MNRADYNKIVKSMFIGAIFALPIVIVFDVLIQAYLSLLVMSVIDIVIFIVAGVTGFLIIDNRNKKIEKKREELKAQKRQND